MFDNIRNTMNFDEVLFESRNKDYGAYQLRKRYNSVMVFSLFVAVAVFCLAVLLPFVLRPKNEKVLAGASGYRSVKMETFEPPEDIYIPPVAPPPPPSAAEQVTRYVPPVVVDTLEFLAPTLPTIEDIENIPDETIDMVGTGEGTSAEGVEGGIPTEEPFFFVEQMPTFRGGDINKFRLWVQTRTNYPQEAIDRKIRGKVQLTFIVETDGSVSNVTVVSSLDPIIDNEAVKAIQASPRWAPGLQRGQPVRVRYSIVLNFTL